MARLLRIVIPALCAAVLTCHLYALKIAGDAWQSDPVASLSRGDGALIQTLGLVLFAVALILLACQLNVAAPDLVRRAAGRAIQSLIAGSACLVCFAAWVFTVTEAFDQWLLAAIASTIGTSMGLLVPCLKQSHRRASLFNAVIFTLWCLLIPVGLLMPGEDLGAYQRFSGLVLWFWVLQMAFLMQASPAR